MAGRMSIHFLNCSGVIQRELVNYRVRTDLGIDSRPHPVHCISTWYQSIFVHQHQSNRKIVKYMYDVRICLFLCIL